MFKKKKDMKKKYFAPNMEVVKIQTQQMLAASPSAELYGENATEPGMAPEFEWTDWEF